MLSILCLNLSFYLATWPPGSQGGPAGYHVFRPKRYY